MVMKGLLVAGAVLLLAQNINAELNTEELEKIAAERVMVEIEIIEKKFFFIDSSNIKYTRERAKALCESLNSTMVQFDTKSKWFAIAQWLNESPFPDRTFWTGALRDPNTTLWYWEETGAEIVDTFWMRNEPNVEQDRTGCMTINVFYGGWADERCTAPDYFFHAMCEF